MCYQVIPVCLRKVNPFGFIFFIIISAFLFSPLQTFIYPQTEEDLNTNYSKAHVSLDGYNLFYVRGLESYPAEERARIIQERIEIVAKDTKMSPDSIQVIHKEDYDEISLSGVLLLRVLDSDAALEGVRRDNFSTVIKIRIAKAIYNFRYERRQDVLLNKALYSAASIIICFILVFIVHFIIRKISSLIEEKIKIRIQSIESRSFQLIRSNQIWITIKSFITGIRILLIVIIIFLTLQYVLGLFPWTRFISTSLLGLFIKPLSDFGIAILKFIPDLAFLIVIFFITRYSLKLLKLLFTGLNQGNFEISGFDPDWALPTYKIVRLFLIAFAVIVAYPYIPGSDSEAFKGVSLFIGVLFSLGSSSVIGNVIAGYTMTYRKTFKIGDVVQIENNIGRVMDIKLFVTRIHTPKNEEVIIPNSSILNTNVINYTTLSKAKGLVIHTIVGIGYETPWRQVEGMLLLAADRTTTALKDPKPFVHQKLLGDFAVNYEINAYIEDPVNMPKVYSELHQNILDVFNENNIQIMTPAYEGDPEQPKVVPKDQWFTPIAGKDKTDEGN